MEGDHKYDAKNAFLHKLTTLHRQKLGRFSTISTVSVLVFFFSAVDVSWARPSGAVSHSSEETPMSLGQLEPCHLLWMWLMCRFRCRGQAVHSAGLGFLPLLLRLHFFPPSQKANRHVITQHLCTARTPSGIHLASAAHGAALTAPFFLHTCYSQEVGVVLNDDRNLPLPRGLGSYCKLCRSDENAADVWAGGAFGRWHGNIEQRFSRWTFYLWSNFYDELDIYSTWWGFCGGLPFLPVQNWLVNVVNTDHIKDKVSIIFQHCFSCLNFCSSNQIIGPHERHKPTFVCTESQFGANLFQNASRGLSITAGDTSDIPLCSLSTHNKLITSHLCDTLFFKWLQNGKQGVSNFDDCLALWLTPHFG